MTPLPATVSRQKGRRATTDRPRLSAPRARAESDVRNKGRIGRKSLEQLCHTTVTTLLSVHLHTRAHTHKRQPGTRVVTVAGQVQP